MCKVSGWSGMLSYDLQALFCFRRSHGLSHPRPKVTEQTVNSQLFDLHEFLQMGPQNGQCNKAGVSDVQPEGKIQPIEPYGLAHVLLLWLGIVGRMNGGVTRLQNVGLRALLETCQQWGVKQWLH